MILSRYTINNINSNTVQVPHAAVFGLPEKVLQFGTGALLRGIPDSIIDKANRLGIFNGRIVAVELTSNNAAAFHQQDCLYTICKRNVHNDEQIKENSITSSISRVLMGDEWQQVLECAHNPEMKVVISHTTEGDFQLMHDDVRLHPPKSFPGKLLAVLYERFKTFGGSDQSGMVIVPTERLPENGRKLESLVFELAHLNGLEDNFIEWLETCNLFCNSLIEGTVQASPDADTEKGLGYKDSLLLIAEAQYLWAIEGDAQVKAILSFAQADNSVVVDLTLERFRGLTQNVLNESKLSHASLNLNTSNKLY